VQALCETRRVGVVLISAGLFLLAAGGLRSYGLAREALGPLVHDGDPTRTAIEASRPILERPRVRLFMRRLVFSIVWLVVAMYGLYLLSVGGTLV
jgi:hypothetical protein